MRYQLGGFEKVRESDRPKHLLHIQVSSGGNTLACSLQGLNGLFKVIWCGRFGVAALAFWPYFSKVDKDILYAGLDIGVWAAIGIASSSHTACIECNIARVAGFEHATRAGYLAQAQGLLTTDASHASFISALTVIVVPILVGLSGRGVRALTWVSAFVAFIGVGEQHRPNR